MENNTLLILLALFAFLFLSNNGNLGGSFCGNLIEGADIHDTCKHISKTDVSCTHNDECHQARNRSRICTNGKCARHSELANLSWGANGNDDSYKEMIGNAMDIHNSNDPNETIICQSDGGPHILPLHHSTHKDTHMQHLKSIYMNANNRRELRELARQVLQQHNIIGTIGPGH